MATVTNTIKLPDGTSPDFAAVEIELVAADSGHAAGWITATDITVLSIARPTVTAGAWSAALTPNDDIDPSGTVYRINEYAGRLRYTHYIDVPTGGGTVHDLLVDAPAALTSAALTVHAALTTAHGLGGASVSDAQLKGWVSGEGYQLTAITRNANGTPTTATALWPDGSAGVFTATTINATFATVDAYTITHTTSSKTVTQTAVTRDSAGAVTVKPALTVA